MVHEIEPGIVYRNENLTVMAFAVQHGSWKHAFGYRFETADRTVVVSGDGTYSPSVIERCNGCDVLIHEMYSQRGYSSRPPEWQRYHAAFQTSTHQLAEIARRARPCILVLYHELLWGRPKEELLEEIRATYSGDVVSGGNLDIY